MLRQAFVNSQLLRVSPNTGEWAAVVHRALVNTPAAHCLGAVYAKPYEREKQQHTTHVMCSTHVHSSTAALLTSTFARAPAPKNLEAPSAAPCAQAAAPRTPTRASHDTE